MDPVLASKAQLLAIQSTLVNRALDGLGEDEAWQRPSEHSNSIGWIVGHMTFSRNGMLQALGGEPEAMPWGRKFMRGAEPAERSDYPPLSEIVAALKRINEKLKQRMAEATEAELSAPCPIPVPSPDKSVRGVVGFLTFHDGYHVGQIAYVLRLLGRSQLVG